MHENELPQLGHLDVFAIESGGTDSRSLEGNDGEPVAVFGAVEPRLIVGLGVLGHFGGLAPLLRIEHLPLGLGAEVVDDQRGGADDGDEHAFCCDLENLDLWHWLPLSAIGSRVLPQHMAGACHCHRVLLISMYNDLQSNPRDEGSVWGR